MKRYLSLCLVALSVLVTFNACSDVPAPYGIPGQDINTGILEEGTYVDESFTSDFGSFTAVTEEGTPWVIDFKTAKASGYDNATQQTAASKGWLISEAFDLTNSSGAYVTFDYILRYVRAGQTENKVLVSTDYFGDVNAATWIDITGTLTEGADWSTFYEYAQNLPAEVIGKNHVNVALFYSCTSTSATWEVKNLTVKEGQVEASGDDDEEETPTPEGTIFSETFANSLGNFTIKNVKEATDLGGEVWQYSSQYTCAKATSYTGGTGGQNIPTESWLISPAIDLSTATSPVLAFEHAANYFNNVSSDVTVWITDANTENWVKLDVPTYPTSFTFVNSGDIDLTSYVGKSVKIGFKYVCESKAGTYELKNFTVKEKTEEDTPSGPVTPAVSVTYTKVTTISAGTYIIAANVDGTQKVATPLGATANYGYLKNPVDATADGNSITLTSAANEFVIESTTGGYTIKDGNNKYYYMTGTFNSFNVGTSLPSEGGVWTIDFNADGSVNITNTTMNKTLQYDTEFTSYGAYDTVKAILPSLYKKN